MDSLCDHESQRKHIVKMQVLTGNESNATLLDVNKILMNHTNQHWS